MIVPELVELAEVLAYEAALFRLGRQAFLRGGGRLDLLALGSPGRVVLIEVKRDVGQQLSHALEYAGWAYSTNLDEVAALYSRETMPFLVNG